MTLFFLFQPACIALRHRGRIFLGINWVTPVRHIVALSSKNIEGLDHHATETTRVLIPSLTAVNDKRIAPSIIHLVPLFESHENIVTTLNFFHHWMVLKRQQCTLRRASIRRDPSAICRVLSASLTQVFVDLWISKFGPDLLCKIEIKEIFGQIRFCLSCACARQEKETDHGR